MKNRVMKISCSIFIGSIITFSVLYGPQGILNELAIQYRLSATEASLAIAVPTITMAISLLFIPALSNVYGRKPLMVCSLLLSSCLNMALAFSQNFEFFLAIRALQGVLVSGFPAIAVTYISEEIPVEKYSQAIAMYVTGTGAGGFLGRIFVSYFTDMYSWMLALGLFGGVNVALALLFFMFLPSSQHFQSVQLSLQTWAHSFYVVGTNKFLWLLYAIGFFSMGTFVTLFNYIGFRLLSSPFSLSQTAIGFLFIFQFAGSLGSNVAGMLVRRYTKPVLLLYAVLLSVSGVLLTTRSQLVGVMLGLFLFSVGFFAAHTIASGWVSAEMNGEYKPYASSLYLICYYMGASVVSTAGGLAFDQFDWNGLVATLLVGFLSIALIAGGLSMKAFTENKKAVRVS